MAKGHLASNWERDWCQCRGRRKRRSCCHCKLAHRFRSDAVAAAPHGSGLGYFTRSYKQQARLPSCGQQRWSWQATAPSGRGYKGGRRGARCCCCKVSMGRGGSGGGGWWGRWDCVVRDSADADWARRERLVCLGQAWSAETALHWAYSGISACIWHPAYVVISAQLSFGS